MWQVLRRLPREPEGSINIMMFMFHIHRMPDWWAWVEWGVYDTGLDFEVIIAGIAFDFSIVWG